MLDRRSLRRMLAKYRPLIEAAKTQCPRLESAPPRRPLPLHRFRSPIPGPRPPPAPFDLLTRPRDGECLCAPISQQQLADAVGSVREVVARVLRELRDAGIVRGGARGIAILDPIRLHDEGWPDEDQGPVAGA